MKKYLLDTNYLLSYLLNDIIDQAEIVEKYFKQAKAEVISITVPLLVFVELDYALAKFYRLEKSHVADKMLLIAKMPYLDIEKREVILTALSLYMDSNFDLIDLLFYSEAKLEGKELLTFDKKLKKLRRKNL